MGFVGDGVEVLKGFLGLRNSLAVVYRNTQKCKITKQKLPGCNIQKYTKIYRNIQKCKITKQKVSACNVQKLLRLFSFSVAALGFV